MLPRKLVLLLLLELLTVHGQLITEAPNELKTVNNKYDHDKILNINNKEQYKMIQLSSSDTIDCHYNESLILNGMGIRIMRDNIIQSNCIREISLQENFLDRVPSKIFNLVPYMACLNLAENHLNLYVENPMEHRYLRVLNISYQLSTKPLPSIGSYIDDYWESGTILKKITQFNSTNMVFPRLEHLDLSGNEISTLIKGFNVSFPRLTHLYLKDIKAVNLDFMFFEKLPESLKVLHLEKNSLEDLSLTNMANVSFLYLDENPLYKLNITNNKLRVLSLNNCSLVTSEVTLITQYLEELDLSANGFHYLPDNLFQYLHSLHTLILNHNRISKIPAYQRAYGLLRLSLNYNNISYIPAHGFQHMPILKELSLKGNELRHIEKNTFLDLNWLETLDLSENRLRSLPYGWSMPLRNLVYLNVNSNLFATITDVSVGSSTISLKHLYIKNNTFTTMTMAEVGTLPNSITVYLV